MKIILVAVPDEKLLRDISSIQLRNHNIVVLNNADYIKHYLEEYMPEYVILSDKFKNCEEIAEYIRSNSCSELLFVGPQENKSPLYMDLHLSEIKNSSDIKKILYTIDNLNPDEDSEVKRNYRLIGQQVISFCSIQGGVGKTSIAFNFAWYVKRIIEGKVLIVDLNFCEGPSDLTINLGLNLSPNLSVFIEKIMDGKHYLDNSVINLENDNKIDILQPPLSIYQSDKFNIDMLDSLIYSARSKYDIIIADVPFRYDNISLEMLNLSTASIIVLSPDVKLMPRVSNFKKFLPDGQKKGVIFNKIGNGNKSYINEFKDIIGIPVYGRISFIPEEIKGVILDGKNSFNILNLQSQMSDLADFIF
jgi:cellulose biosynthesis protein BcsQ